MSSWQNISNNNYTNPQSGRFNYVKANEITTDTINVNDLVINDNLIVNGDISCNDDVLLNDGHNVFIGRYRFGNSLPGLRLHYNSNANYASVLDFSGTYFAVRKNLNGSDVEKFYVDANKGFTDVSFGIGTTNPEAKLDVSGGDIIIRGQFYSNSSSAIHDKIFIRDNTNSPDYGYLYYNKYGTLGRNITISSVPNEKWKIDADGVLSTTSDDRLKEDEIYINGASETLMKLKPQIYKKYLKFKPRDPEDNYIIETGLIAQEVFYNAPELRELVILPSDASLNLILNNDIPDMSNPQKDPDYESLGWGKSNALFNYTGLIPYLVKAIQEQQEIIKKQQEEIDFIKSKININ